MNPRILRLDVGKLLVLLVIILTAGVLGALGVLGESTVTNVLFGALGYVVGNGALAIAGKAPSPAVADVAAIIRQHLDEALAANVAHPTPAVLSEDPES